MSSVIESLDTTIDPQQEVKKLQSLVKKLERQNEALRSRHNKTMSSLSPETSTVDENSQRTPSQSPRIDIKQKTNQPVVIDNKKDDSPEKMTTDDTDVVDVHNDLDDKEDSWLFESPKKLLPSQSRVSPYKWMREEFVKSDCEISTARKSLLFKIEEVSSPRSGNLTYRSYSSPSKSNNNSSFLSNGSSPLIRQSLIGSGIPGSHIDTGTYTRPKKKKRSPISGYSSERSMDDSREVSPEDEMDQGDGDSRMNNVLDIQALARAQEASLRQSYNSPIASPRRSGLRASSKNNNGVPPLPLNDLDSSSPQSSNRSSPGRFDDSTYNPRLTRRLSKSKNSVASASSHSSGSSPPESPYGSQYLDNSGRENSKVSGIRHVESETKLTAPGRRSIGGIRPNASTGHLNPKMSPGRPTSPALKSIGNTSPRRSASPAGRSSIPRPGSAPRSSGIPAPRRSAIPSPRTGRGRQGDDSWKEGCF